MSVIIHIIVENDSKAIESSIIKSSQISDVRFVHQRGAVAVNSQGQGEDPTIASELEVSLVNGTIKYFYTDKPIVLRILSGKGVVFEGSNLEEFEKAYLNEIV